MALTLQIQRIREYTQRHEELLRAHHFLYDKPINTDVSRYRFAVLGVNPGEQAGDWAAWSEPTEETSLFDFREQLGQRPPASRRWRQLVEYFCGTDAVVMSEFFLWSTKDTGDAFLAKFGHRIEQSPHLAFCVEMNRELIEAYGVSAVVAPGLKSLALFGKQYGLSHVRTVRTDNGHVLVDHYQRDGVPWLFTKHWSAAFGFSKEQRELVRDYIAETCTTANGPNEAAPTP